MDLVTSLSYQILRLFCIVKQKPKNILFVARYMEYEMRSKNISTRDSDYAITRAQVRFPTRTSIYVINLKFVILDFEIFQEYLSFKYVFSCINIIEVTVRTIRKICFFFK